MSYTRKSSRPIHAHDNPLFFCRHVAYTRPRRNDTIAHLKNPRPVFHTALSAVTYAFYFPLVSRPSRPLWLSHSLTLVYTCVSSKRSRKTVEFRDRFDGENDVQYEHEGDGFFSEFFFYAVVGRKMPTLERRRPSMSNVHCGRNEKPTDVRRESSKRVVVHVNDRPTGFDVANYHRRVYRLFRCRKFTGARREDSRGLSCFTIFVHARIRT